jgi:hypothetical protein
MQGLLQLCSHVDGPSLPKSTLQAANGKLMWCIELSLFSRNKEFSSPVMPNPTICERSDNLQMI